MQAPAREPPRRVAAGNTLVGNPLRLVRALTLGTAMLALVLFAGAVPARLAELQLNEQIARWVVITLSPTDQARWFSLGIPLDQYPAFALALEVGLMLALSGAAGVVALRRSDDWLALMLVMGMVTYGAYVLPVLDADFTRSSLVRLANRTVQAVGLSSALAFLYLFPTGRFVPPVTAVFLALWSLWAAVWIVFPQSPLDLSQPFSLHVPRFVALMVWWLSGLLAQVYRFYKVSDYSLRQQTKLALIAVIFIILAYGAFIPLRYVVPRLESGVLLQLLVSLFGVHAFLVTLAIVPLSITMSILRYRLWDIDIFINRTLVYGLLALALAAVYVVLALGLQEIFWRATGQEQNEVVTALATLGIAMAFAPVRHRARQLVDRMLFRKKYQAERAINEFTARLPDETDLTRLQRDMAAVVTQVMSPAHVSLWLRDRSKER